MTLKMKMVGGIVIALLLAGSVLADDRSMQVFIKDGVLYGSSTEALVESNLLTGELSIRYRDGKTYEAQLDSRRMEQSTLAHLGETLWLTGEDSARDSLGLMAICSAEAAAVQAAVTLVQNACSGGESNSCDSARAALQDAQSEFDNCIRQFLEMY